MTNFNLDYFKTVCIIKSQSQVDWHRQSDNLYQNYKTSRKKFFDKIMKEDLNIHINVSKWTVLYLRMKGSLKWNSVLKGLREWDIEIS